MNEAPAIDGTALRPMREAPRDGTQILAVLHPDLAARTGRSDLDPIDGRALVTRSLADLTPGEDMMGWSWAPGYGGLADAWFVGWMPLPREIAAITTATDDALRARCAERRSKT